MTDPNDLTILERAYDSFLATDDRPTLIIVHSHIGYGAPHKQDTAKAHGEPLGNDEARLSKEFFGFSGDANFVVPEGVREHFAANLGARGARLHRAWDERFERYRAQYPDLADQVERIRQRKLPDDWEEGLLSFPPSPKGMSTREASGKVLNALAAKVPWLVGGAADLAPSTKTRLAFEFARDFQAPGELGEATYVPAFARARPPSERRLNHSRADAEAGRIAPRGATASAHRHCDDEALVGRVDAARERLSRSVEVGNDEQVAVRDIPSSQPMGSLLSIRGGAASSPDKDARELRRDYARDVLCARGDGATIEVSWPGPCFRSGT